MPEESIAKHPFRAWTVLLLTLLFLIPAGALISPSSGSGSGDAQTAPPTRQTWLDIAIDDIRVNKPTQSNNLYPGQTVRIDIHLKHDDRPYISDIPITRANGNQFTVVMVVDDGFDNVTTKYSQVTSMTLNYTGADQPGAGARNPPLVISFSWDIPLRPPSGQSWSTFQFNIYTTITVDDDDKSDNFRSGSGVRVSEPEFAPFIWEEGQDEKKYESPIPHSVNVGEVLFVPFELQNQGPAIDIIGIKVLSKPDGWNVEGFQPRTVYPNDFELLQLPVQVSRDPFQAKSDEGYPIIVKAYSTLYAGPYNLPAEHTFRFEVRKKPGVDLRPVSESVYLIPGTQTNVYFNLYNRGNFEDDYTLNAKVDDVHIRKGWRVDFASGTKLPSDVLPGAEEPFRVITKITVPENAPRFYSVNLILTVRSNTMDYNTESDSCTLFADIRYAASIQHFEEPILVEPGRENKMKFNFTNLGNDRDPNQELKIFYKPRGWWVGIDQTPLQRVKGLGPQTTALLDMVVFVEETTVASSKGSQGLPFIVIQAVGGPFDPPHVLAEERIYFEIPLKYKVEITTPQKEKVGFVGGQVEYTINVRNLGNWLDTFNLSVDSDWAEFDLDLSNQEIAPNETFPVKLIVEIPFDAAADTDPDTPLPNLKGFYEGYSIRISGYSQNETRQGSTLTFLDLEIHVQPFYNFQMDIDPSEPELKFSMDHDQARAVRVKVTNTGNIADVIKLDWVDNPYQDWLRLQSTYVDIAFGETAYAVLNINPRAYTIEEECSITVKMKGISQPTPGADQTEPLEFILPIEIKFYRLMFDIRDPRVNNETFTQVFKGVRDRKYSFQVGVENIGTEELNPTRFDELEIVLYDGSFEVDRANITYLKLQETSEVVFTWTASSPGNHKFTVLLEGNIPISEQGVMEKTFNVYIPIDLRDDDEDGETMPLWMILVPLILIIIFAAAAFVFIVKYNQIIISPIDTGYDETGEYRPWAIKEKMKGEPEKLGQAQEAQALPPPSAPALPAAPAAQSQQVPVRSGPVPAQRPPQPMQHQPMAQARPMQAPVPARQPPRPMPQGAGMPPQPRSAAPITPPRTMGLQGATQMPARPPVQPPKQ